MGSISLEKKYVSIYGSSQKITAAQYICELICSRRAKADNIELPDQFWLKGKMNANVWCNYFARQSRHAINLIKRYGEANVIDAIRNNPCIYSLGNDHLEMYCEQNAEKFNKPKEKTVLVSSKSVPQKRFKPKNKLSNL